MGMENRPYVPLPPPSLLVLKFLRRLIKGIGGEVLREREAHRMSTLNPLMPISILEGDMDGCNEGQPSRGEV